MSSTDTATQQIREDAKALTLWASRYAYQALQNDDTIRNSATKHLYDLCTSLLPAPRLYGKIYNALSAAQSTDKKIQDLHSAFKETHGGKDLRSALKDAVSDPSSGSTTPFQILREAKEMTDGLKEEKQETIAEDYPLWPELHSMRKTFAKSEFDGPMLKESEFPGLWKDGAWLANATHDWRMKILSHDNDQEVEQWFEDAGSGACEPFKMSHVLVEQAVNAMLQDKVSKLLSEDGQVSDNTDQTTKDFLAHRARGLVHASFKESTGAWSTLEGRLKACQESPLSGERTLAHSRVFEATGKGNVNGKGCAPKTPMWGDKENEEAERSAVVEARKKVMAANSQTWRKGSRLARDEIPRELLDYAVARQGAYFNSLPKPTIYSELPPLA